MQIIPVRNKVSLTNNNGQEIFSLNTNTQTTNINQMKNSNRPYRKFLPQQKKIEELEKSSSRFKRIYSEYETMSDELWNLESNETTESILMTLSMPSNYKQLIWKMR
jgi:uncharacterized protein YdcH (DUF465 family)